MQSTLNGGLIEYLQSVVQAADDAGHGGKTAVYQAAADKLGIGKATLYRKIGEIVMPTQRKQRSDASATALTLDDAQHISAFLIESYRANGKQLSSLENAVEVLLSNGRITAGRVDKATGEFAPLSISAIRRGLEVYGLLPKQLSRPSPKVRLASQHPNHVWQIDPSLCVLYYLPRKQSEGLQVMDKTQFYKNKPANIRKIEKERVWRYVITDHASGWVFVHYVLGAESGKNLVDSFIAATQRRDNDPVHGVPLNVMVDPGSANTGAIFQNLCRALEIEVLVNRPGQPWAKGQVEQANNLVECDFEHRLRFLKQPPTTLDEINHYAGQWMCRFNVRNKHSRHGKSRFAVWQTILPDQLRVAPPAQVMRELATTRPEHRLVSVNLTISFKGKTYSVAEVEGVMVGEKLLITRDPWGADNSARVVVTDEDGRDVFVPLEAEEYDAFGFPTTAVMIGEGYRGMKDGQIDINRKAVERLAMGADTDEAAEKARKKQTVPFNGEIDPMLPITNTPLPDYLPRRGTAMDVASPMIEIKPLGHVAAAKRLTMMLGNKWQGARHFSWLQAEYPAGVMEDELASIARQLAGAGPGHSGPLDVARKTGGG
ncbi:MAG: transposase family protein [Kordiimonadaceae bacterium]|nr:transposase family protein [Kordiimonadaceae bacterium]PCJ37790.1 MAG: integrase [Cellvibrionales bacterium]